MIKIIGLAVVIIIIFVSPFVALLGAAKIWQIRRKHRMFPHMAAVKFGMFLGLGCLAMSIVDPNSPGFRVHLTGWQGWWFVSGYACIVLPLCALVLYLLGLKNGSAHPVE